MSKRKKPAGRKTAPLDAEALTWPPFFERLGLRMDGSRPRPSVRDVERAFDFWRTLPDRMRRKGWPCGASAAERLNRLWSFHLAAEEILCVEAERLGLDSSSIWESGEACYNLLLRQPRFADRTTPPNRIAYWPHCLGRRRAGLSADEKQAVLAAERVLARLFKKLPAEADTKRARQTGNEKTAHQDFTFAAGQALFNGRDLGLPAGLPVVVLTRLVSDCPKTAKHNDLDDSEEHGNEAGEKLRAAVAAIRRALKRHKVPYTITTKRGEGYALQPA